MRQVPRPQVVQLDKDEAELAEIADLDGRDIADSHDERLASLEAGRILAEGLFGRAAIPKMRVAYFTDPALNIGSQQSRYENFKRNIHGDTPLFEHPHFAKYLKYFIYGPDLPAQTIEGFCRILEEDAGTSHMLQDELRRYARAEIRERRLERRIAAEEFFKLALECQDDRGLATSVRDAALSTR